jgi:predicted histone-like DNA-binding protein
MQIFYRIVKKMLPPSVGAEKKSKFYMVINSKGELDLDKITTLIEKRCSVNGADIRGVIYALLQVAIEGLKDGQIVRLGELGSLRLIVSSKGSDTIDQVNASAVKDCKVHFTPGKALKNMKKELKFKKMKE